MTVDESERYAFGIKDDMSAAEIYIEDLQQRIARVTAEWNTHNNELMILQEQERELLTKAARIRDVKIELNNTLEVLRRALSCVKLAK